MSHTQIRVHLEEPYAPRWRKVAIRVDGLIAAHIAREGVVAISVDPGAHVLTAHLDVMSSPMMILKVAPEETIELDVNVPQSTTVAMLTSPRRAIQLTRRRQRGHSVESVPSAVTNRG